MNQQELTRWVALYVNGDNVTYFDLELDTF